AGGVMILWARHASASGAAVSSSAQRPVSDPGLGVVWASGFATGGASTIFMPGGDGVGALQYTANSETLTKLSPFASPMRTKRAVVPGTCTARVRRPCPVFTTLASSVISL